MSHAAGARSVPNSGGLASGGPPGGGRTIRLFILRFLAGWVAALLTLSAFPGIEDWAVRDTVRSLRFVLGIPLHASHQAESEDVLRVGDQSWQVVPDCTPLMPAITLALAMVCFPGTLRWKGAGIAVGTVLVWLFNLTRLVLLHFVEVLIPAAAAIVHVYFFQTLAFLFVCIIFMGWIDVQARRKPA